MEGEGRREWEVWVGMELYVFWVRVGLVEEDVVRSS